MNVLKSKCWRRRSKGIRLAGNRMVVWLWTILCALAAVGESAGGTPSELVVKGNGFYREGKYDRAELFYKDALKVLPESPEVNFNLGCVRYRKGDYAAAEEYFGKATESANASRTLRKKALYNLGNCAFKMGEKLVDSDLQKALDSFKLSILRYHDVIAGEELGRGVGGEDAKYNIEVARLRIRDILDKLKQQEEKRKQQQKQQEEFIKKLKEAIKKEEEIVKETGQANERKQQGEDVSAAVDGLTKKQAENKKGTNELSQQLQQQIEAAKAGSGGGKGSRVSADKNVLSAQSSLKESEIEQGTSLEHLGRQALAEAKSSEETALRNLKDALARLTKPQQAQPQPGKRPQQNEQGVKKQQEKKEGQGNKEEENKGENRGKMTPEQAREELAKLRKQASEMRKQNLQRLLRRRPDYSYRKREYEPVEKDW